MPITRVGIVAKSGLREAAGVLAEIAGWLDARGVRAVFERETAALAGLPPGRETFDKDVLAREVDLILSLGGDGTLLGMADRVAAARVDIPILGVNFGGLGFLTEVTLPELYDALETTLAGVAPVLERLLLQSTVLRAGEPFVERVVLNDVVITKGALSRIIDLSVTVGDEFVARFKADGLIVASATGSTAYNLAAGGPIVHPSVDAIVLTPIAPHTLTNRPVVIPATAEVRVQPLVDTNTEVFVTYDGQAGYPLAPDDVVSVKRAWTVKLIGAATRGYFEVLRQKLKWGER